MEIFLLLLDELDDMATALRALWPQLLGFMLACSIFCLSVWMAMRWPNFALTALIVTMLLAAAPLLSQKTLSFKTDP